MEIMNKQGYFWRVVDVIALVIIVLEAILAAVLGFGYAFYAVADERLARLGWGLAVVLAILAAAMFAVAYAWAKSRRWATGAALSWQLMQASMGVWFFGADALVGLALLLSAAVVGFAAVRRHLRWAATQSQEQDL